MKEEVAAFFSGVVIGETDILAPNLFELSRLSGFEAEDANSAVTAARQLIGDRLRLVLVTSVPSDHRHARGTGALAVTTEAAWQVSTPQLHFDIAIGGTGDLFTALFLARYLSDKGVADSLSLAVSGIYGVLEETKHQGRSEMALVAAQGYFAEPPSVFPAVRIA